MKITKIMLENFESLVATIREAWHRAQIAKSQGLHVCGWYSDMPELHLWRYEDFEAILNYYDCTEALDEQKGERYFLFESVRCFTLIKEEDRTIEESE